MTLIISKYDIVGAAAQLETGSDEVKKLRGELEIASQDERFGTFVRDALGQLGHGVSPVRMVAFIVHISMTVGVLAERARLRRKGILIPED